MKGLLLELEGRWAEASDWLQDHSCGVFCQWFDVSLRSLVHDLVDEPLIDDETDAQNDSGDQLLN